MRAPAAPVEPCIDNGYRVAREAATDSSDFQRRWRSLNLEATLRATDLAGGTRRLTLAAPGGPADAGLHAAPTLRAGSAYALDANVAARATVSASAPAAPALESLPRLALESVADAPTPARGSHADLRMMHTLGEGGMGRVSLAEQRSLGRTVAVKTLKDGAGAASRAALLSEAVLTGYLQHPGVIPIHVLGVDDQGRPVLVMKRVEGVEWSRLIHDDAEPAWQWESLHDDHLLAHLEIFMQVCNAVSFAHSQGVVHRDIKPDNIMIGRYGEVYLLDWGIALRLSDDPAAHAGELVGTPSYMAPEMVMGEAVGPAADVYLLGATLHEVLTRAPRHAGGSLHEVLLRACQSKPPAFSDGVPEELGRLVADATAADPAARPASAADLRRRVKDYLRHRGSVALSDAAAESLGELGGCLARRESEWLVQARRLATQARFGFAQALEQWPDNPAAAEGLQRTLTLVVEMELSRDDAAAARAALAELTQAPPELAARVEALEQRHAAQRVENRRLRALASDLDVRVSRRERLLGLGVVLVLSLAVALVALYQVGPEGPTYMEALHIAAVVPFTLGLVVVLFGKALFKNELNRRLSLTFMLAGLSIVAHRLFLWRFEPPLPQVFVGDLLLVAMAAAVGAVTILRPLWYTAAVVALGAGAVVWMPERAVPIFVATSVVGLASCAVVVRGKD